jgi:hypothetical protein
LLVTQGNLSITTTRVGTVMLVIKLDIKNIKKSKELKVPHHASIVAICDSNFILYNSKSPYIKVIYLI